MSRNTWKEGGQSLAGESRWLGRCGAREAEVVAVEVPEAWVQEWGRCIPLAELRTLACRQSV